MRKFPGKVGGLKDRHPMLSSGDDVTSMSWGGKAVLNCHIATLPNLPFLLTKGPTMDFPGPKNSITLFLT